MATGAFEARRHAKERRPGLFIISGLLALAVVVTVVVALRPAAQPPAVAAPPPSVATPAAADPGPAPSDPPALAAWDPAEEVADPLDDVDPGFDVLDPVDLDEDAAFEDGVLARIVEIERDEVGAKGPGESAGSGVVVTVELENTGDEAIALDSVVVDFYDDAEAPAVVSYGDVRTSEFSAALEPGATARATYVARLTAPTESLTLTVSYEPGAPAVSFTGKL